MWNYLILLCGIIVLSAYCQSKNEENKVVGNWEFDYIYDLKSQSKRCLYFNPDSSTNFFSISIAPDSFVCTIDCNPIIGIYEVRDHKIKFNWEKLFDYSDICIDGSKCLNTSFLKSKMKNPTKYEIISDTILNLYFTEQEYYSFIKF